MQHYSLHRMSPMPARKSGRHIQFFDQMRGSRLGSVPSISSSRKSGGRPSSGDLEAPSDPTAGRLKALPVKGQPITLAIFPHAEHGIYEFETEPDGERVNTRNADGYFAMMRDFARDGRLKGPYGASVVTLPKLPK